MVPEDTPTPNGPTNKHMKCIAHLWILWHSESSKGSALMRDGVDLTHDLFSFLALLL